MQEADDDRVKMKPAIAVASTAALLAAVVFFASHRGDRSSAPRSAPGSAVSSAPAKSSSATAAVDAPAPTSISRVSKLSELEVVANREKQGQALFELQLALGFCEGAAFAKKMPPPTVKLRQSPEWEKKQAFLRNFSERFCDDTATTLESTFGRVAAMEANDLATQAAHLAPPADVDTADATDFAIAHRLANQSESPAALLRAADFLFLRDEELPAAQKVKPPLSLDASKRIEAQRLAVRMVSCQVRGGCGPDQLYTAVWCTACAPGTSLEQQWQQQYSPDTLKYARAIAGEILTAKDPSK